MITAQKLFFLLLFSCNSILFSAADIPQDQDQFIYNGFSEANLVLDGIAEVNSEGLLQLTNTSTQKTGHAFNRFPVRFNASSSSSSSSSSSGSLSYSFSTNFVFSIVPELKNYGGHGLAFVISPSTDFIHATATQYLGLFNSSDNGLATNHVLAVEIDTVLSPDFQDINDNHVGIDVNNLISLQSAPATYYSDDERRNITVDLSSGDPIQVWIEYDGVAKLLNVTVAPSKIPKPRNPLLSTPIDLSEILLDTMHIGFSAATGQIASNHYILGWSFNMSSVPAQSLDISKLPPIPMPGKALLSLRNLLIMSTAIAVFLILAILFFAWCFYMRRKFAEMREEWEKEYGPQRFCYKTLYKATHGFKEKLLLGSGGFGKVYMGTLGNNDQIAVKRINHDSEQGMKEFVSEIVAMGRLRHRNLVSLLGYCRRRNELLLVYEYMPNGSLDKLLFSNGEQKLTWPQRFHIAKGVASALVYLHEEWEQVVLHRDIKASNVMLDGNLNARLGDFGLARLHDHDKNPQTTKLVGTLGYLAPELPQTGKATTHSDVFAFGAFLLEVACGRQPFKPQDQPGEVFLVDLVANCWKRNAILDAADPGLQGDFIADEMELVLKLGLICCQTSPESRPRMKQVVQYLQGNGSLEDAQLIYGETGRSRANDQESIPLDPKMMPFTRSDIRASEISISIQSILTESSQLSLSRSESVLYIGR